ncbi:MAG: plasmid replication initiator TrfA [Burkholderiales bacterium]
MNGKADAPAIAARIQDKAEQRKSAHNVMQLPLWPEPVRAIPNSFLRSALFSVIAYQDRKYRRYINDVDLAAIGGVIIRYKGEQLDQDDLDVLGAIFHTMRYSQLVNECRITGYRLLQLLGKPDTGRYRATLQTRIKRLVATAITVKQGRYSYIGSLIVRASMDEETNEWVIELDAKLCSLFAADQFTQIEWAVRHAFKRNQFAKWLHAFYASHAKPFPMHMKTLLKLCGSKDSNPRSAQQTLRKALDVVVKVSAVHGERFSYDIRGDLVHVEKKGSEAQRRHLAKKASKLRAARA